MTCYEKQFPAGNRAFRHLAAVLALAVAGVGAGSALAQSGQEQPSYWGDQDPSRGFNLQNSSGGVVPYRPGFGGRSPNGFRRAPYNILLGPVSARFSAGLSASYMDNALMSDQNLRSSDDFTITPTVNTALEWQVTEMNGIRIDIGIGYQKHINLTELDALYVSPNSTIDWQFILGDVRLSLYNQTTSFSERPELTGNGSPASIAFRRIQNTTGLSAAWQVAQDLSVQGGYSYNLDRGIVSGFENLDRDNHSMSVAVYERLSPVWTVGVNGSFSKFTFNNGFQNNGMSYSGGVLGAWHPSKFINVSANVRYNITSFDSGGQISDASNFNGINFDISAFHRIHRDWSHNLSVGQGVNTGFGSNFTKQFTTSYGLFWTGIENLGVSLNASYIIAEESGTTQTIPRELLRVLDPRDFDPSRPGMVDEGGGRLYYFPSGYVDRGAAAGVVDFILPGRQTDWFQISLGVTHAFGKKLSGGLTYTYAIRNSDVTLRNFSQNTVTLTLSYQF